MRVPISATASALSSGKARGSAGSRLAAMSVSRVALLRSTGDAEVEEDSPHDAVWGVGPNGDGTNLLGKTFMALREEMNE